MNFRDFLEGMEDANIRAEASDITNKIINFIDNDPKNQYGIGLEFDSKYGLKIGEILPSHPNLWLKFINQPGFGKNKTALGIYDKSVISIALPMRTYNVALSVALRNGERLYSRRNIAKVVANFLKKNYETLVHEIIHYLDGQRTKNKVFRNYPKDTSIENDYYNHPAEYNANLQSFLVRTQNNTLQDMMNLLKKEYWYNLLNDNLKRHVLKRIFLSKQQI